MRIPCPNPGNASAISDEELVERSQCGCLRSREQLVTRYRSLVHSRSRAYFIAGGSSEDVIQEGMIGLCYAMRDYRHNSQPHFHSFALLCIKRNIVTALKGANRYKHRLLNASLPLHQRCASDADNTLLLVDCLPDPRNHDPKHLVLSQYEQTARFDVILSLLSPLEHKVLEGILHHKTHRQIAHELDCSMKAVDNAMQRIRHKAGRVYAEE